MFLLSYLGLKSLRILKHVRFNSTKKKFINVDVSKIRNIGILAHIDAGKTTTTERMLFYSGLINKVGEVHHGNTVTDYMDQERERGITIKSAAITFYWNNYQFNLIDTPGHIDFTMEVEQTLSILDGIVVIVDGSAGVEAQTLTVWRQADRYGIPRIVFVNKMDRTDADFEMSCRSIQEKLNVPVLCLHIPIKTDNVFRGVVDIIAMEKIIFSKDGLDITAISEKDLEFWEKAKEARSQLVDVLCGYDDVLANLVISSESFDVVTTAAILKSLRQVTLRRQAVPVFLGSAYKSIGVQLLMDAVITYLPSPDEFNTFRTIFGDSLCARAFKIIYDKQKGPLTFFRNYNGKLNKGQRICSIQDGISEQCGKLYVAYADEFKEVDSIENGNIAVVSGLKQIKCGDLVTTSQGFAQKVKNQITKLSSNLSNEFKGQKSRFELDPNIPEPVFFCSIEPPSLAYQSALEQALIELQREDPSLRVTNDRDTGQTILSGMGELHLEIIKDRILKEYKIDVDLGPLQIAYLEVPITSVTDSLLLDTKIGNNRQLVNIKLSVIPKPNSVPNSEIMKLDKKSEAASNLASIFPRHLLAIRQGIDVGLTHGPKSGSRVINTEVMLHFFEVGKGTSESMITAAVTQLIQKIIRNVGTNVLEPIMYLEIAAPDDYVSVIMADLARRRANIQNIGVRNDMKLLVATIPLSQLLGYSTTLRTISSGTASFSMEFSEYKVMSAHDEEIAIRTARGF